MKINIILNASARNPAHAYKARRIKEEIEMLGANAEIIKNINLAFLKENKALAAIGGKCVYLDKDKAAAYLLEKAGCRLYNRARAIELCDDKMLTHAALCVSGVNMPVTVPAPLCYYADSPITEEFVSCTEERLGYPFVVKQNRGSFGAEVELIKNREEFLLAENKLRLTPHFYQQFIAPGGEDVRCIVIGGKFVCAMKRKSTGDFRANIELGGRGERFEADEELVEMCELAAKTLGLDYCGVDVLLSRDDKKYLCEVNSNALFSEAERVCAVNIAKKFAELIISE